MLGFEFSVIPSKVKEEFFGKDPVLVARRLAYRKSFNVWKDHKHATVVGADTIVVVGSRMLGKPEDEDSAKRMLRAISGRWHKVVTAVSVISPKRRIIFHDIAWVKIRDLTEREIEDYVKTGEPMDKAGAYAVQGFGATIVERIRGDFYTVMGLPVSKTYRVLKGVLG